MLYLCGVTTPKETPLADLSSLPKTPSQALCTLPQGRAEDEGQRPKSGLPPIEW